MELGMDCGNRAGALRKHEAEAAGGTVAAILSQALLQTSAASMPGCVTDTNLRLSSTLLNMFSLVCALLSLQRCMHIALGMDCGNRAGRSTSASPLTYW